MTIKLILEFAVPPDGAEREGLRRSANILREASNPSI